ncbi:cullin protein 3 [Nitzschia inconspicua]|uniref:Cullin protein 3 n=1 Tax=Nitzschia inconspicua TaxID=303405 RepID=A0A9K3PUR1_9STRA|nr:cullin protein 3 [Nitzschia inconspicua]
MADTRRRFNIKPFRAHVPMDKTVAQQTWGALANAIDEIYNRNASQLSFEELYRNAYNLVLHKYGTLLYEGVTQKLHEHLTATAKRLEEVPDSKLLEEISITWAEHQITMIMVRDILMYMDRTYILKERRRPVYELGLHLFRLDVWEHPNVKERASDLLMMAVANERDGRLTDDRTILKQIVAMLLELGQADSSNVYEIDFETPFLGQTQDFYRVESLSFLSRNTATDYVIKAIRWLEEEKDRANALALPLTTESPLQAMIETELIDRHARTLVDMEMSGFAALLKDDTKLTEMRDMYDLFVRVPSSVDFLREALAERIKADGKALISDQEKGASDPPAFVKGVLTMRERYDKIVDVSFRGEKKTRKRMRESFEDFLNVDARAASCLSVYVDELLRVGLRGATEDQITQELNRVIVIFRYLSDKDVFESFYKQHLAKRLLGGRSVSDDAERAMVSQLKAECGYQFTSKLEGMFNDMRISRDLQDSYKSFKRNQESQQSGETSGNIKAVDIEVDVLTNGYWPSQNVPACTLPPQVQDAIDRYTKYYLEKHTGRKLSWQTSAGAAELKATFGNGLENHHRHELIVSTYQMCILLLFNDYDSLTLGQIRTKTHIPDSELRRHLISLCTPKHRILRKGSRGRGISSDDDIFTFNAEYTSKLKRVRIPLVKESSVSKGGDAASGPASAAASAAVSAVNGSIPLPVEEDRRHLVEAAIVRIMKARKSLGHNDLIAEVTRQLSVRFNPPPQFVKKRIESLIEREYLERTLDDHRVYNYVA